MTKLEHDELIKLIRQACMEGDCQYCIFNETINERDKDEICRFEQNGYGEPYTWQLEDEYDSDWG